MADQSSADVEILAHATAPSRAADDAHYRQLAQAYLAFQPRSRTSFSAVGDGEKHQSEKPRQRDRHYVLSSAQEFATPASGLLELESPDVSFQSALDNRTSPRLRAKERWIAQGIVLSSSQESAAASQPSWCPPPSQIDDSYPLPDADLFRGSPSRFLESYMGYESPPRISPTPQHLHKEVPAGSGNLQNLVPGDQSLSAGQLEPEMDLVHEQVDARDFVPSTPALTKPLARKERDVPEAGDDTVFDVTHISSSHISTGASPWTESEAPPSKRAKQQERSETADLACCWSAEASARKSTAVDASHVRDALEIRPPSPPAGTDDIDPSSLVSAKLAKLAHDLSSRYRPEARRAIEPFERGYWRLDCAAWKPETRLDAWSFLGGYLRSGLAGWGVWCRRDEARGWIRLYCWGHVVKHTYLLLYLASGRNLKLTGAQWIGADGEVAVVVPPHEGQT